MKRAEAEKFVRQFATTWLREIWLPGQGKTEPCEIAFVQWLNESRPECFEFKAGIGSPRNYVEGWFEDEMRQSRYLWS